MARRETDLPFVLHSFSCSTASVRVDQAEPEFLARKHLELDGRTPRR